MKFRDPRLNRSHEIPPEAVMSGRFSNVKNFRPEVARDVISGVLVDPTGTDVLVKFRYYRSNCSRDIRLPHFVTNELRMTPACAAPNGVLPKMDDYGDYDPSYAKGYYVTKIRAEWFDKQLRVHLGPLLLTRESRIHEIS